MLRHPCNERKKEIGELARLRRSIGHSTPRGGQTSGAALALFPRAHARSGRVCGLPRPSALSPWRSLERHTTKLEFGRKGVCSLSALHFALMSLCAGSRRSLLSRLCFVLRTVCYNKDRAVSPARLVRGLSRLCFVARTVRVCVAFLLPVSVAALLELTELAKPAEMPRLCC